MKNQNENPVSTMKQLFNQLEEVRGSIERTNNSKSKGGIVGPKMFENKMVGLKKQEASIVEQISTRLAYLTDNLSKDAKDEIEVYECHKDELEPKNMSENKPF